MSMNVLLIDVDSKMPNLALMKISAWHTARGDRTYLTSSQNKEIEERNPHPASFDKVYISCIFSRNAPIARGMAKMFPNAEIGGYAINGAKLPDEIEHIMPDYDLYGCDFDMGFKTRGCIRTTQTCPWCKVPEVEGYIRDHAPISEFHHPTHKKLLLLDNNILALPPAFRDAIKYIIENDLKVSFCQGLDIRLVNEENAGMLADCKYRSIRFNERRLYFSFDNPNIEPSVRKGVQIFKDNGVPPDHLMVYFICGFDFGDGYDFAVDWHRFEVLRELGVDPYVMKYNGRRDIRILNHFSRWVIKRDYKRKRPKYLRPHEWQELQAAISSVERAS